MHRFFRRKESFPGGRGYIFRKRAGSVASVESIVAIPKRPPTRVISGLDRSNQNFFRHRGYYSVETKPIVSPCIRCGGPGAREPGSPEARKPGSPEAREHGSTGAREHGSTI